MDFAELNKFNQFWNDIEQSNLSEDNKRACRRAFQFASRLSRLIHEYSELYDEGKLSPEKAGDIVEFCYIPVRYDFGDNLTWKNEKSERVWSYEEFYKALVKLIRPDQQS